MVKIIENLTEYDSFINSFSSDPDFSDPHLSAKMKAGGELKDFLSDPCNHCFGVVNSAGVCGLFVFLLIPEEKYAEMLVGLTRDPDAAEEMLAYLETNYAGYAADFVMNPRHHILRGSLAKRGADLEPEQQRMEYTHKATECGLEGIEYLSSEYVDQYLDMHAEDVYWTGERVIEAADRFKTLIALENGIVAGYLDVTYCYDVNEPFDLFVKPEYRRKGYARKLLTKALLDNEPKDMMLLVDVGNLPAIKLYESTGFVKKENGNMLAARWNIAASSWIEADPASARANLHNTNEVTNELQSTVHP